MPEIWNTPDNIEIVEAATAKFIVEEEAAKANTRASRAIAMKHRCYGFGALALCLGAAASLIGGSYTYYVDQQTNWRQPVGALAEALAKTLSSTVIQTTTKGVVEVTTDGAAPLRVGPAEVKVTLEPPPPLRIETSDVVEIMKVLNHYFASRSVSPSARDAKTWVVVEKTARSPSGIDVVTRWEYSRSADLGQGQPLVQRCLVRPSGAGASDRLLEIARDERTGAKPRELQDPQFTEALRYCVWFNPLG